jgi:hypothetical protein
MYTFLLKMWALKKIDIVKVQSYVPLFITQEDANKILETPQQ